MLIGGIKVINIRKCGVVGCGFVGASCEFALVQSGLFSEIVLLDMDEKKAQGEAMDLNHCVSLSDTVKVKAGSYCDLSDCAMIIITAGLNQKPNQTRLDLVKQNASIIKSIVTQIKQHNTECILLVVTNPVDIMSYVAFKTSGFPSSRVIGSGTVLDTTRLKVVLGKKFKIDSRSVHAFIIGEHGDSELAVFSSANVSGIDLEGFCKSVTGEYNKKELDEMYKDVVNSAYEIIEKKGATYYGIAVAITKIAQSIVKNQHTVLPVSVLVNGHYGLNDMYLGIPSIVGSKGVEIVLDIPLDSDEKEKLLRSAKTVKDVLEGINI